MVACEAKGIDHRGGAVQAAATLSRRVGLFLRSSSNGVGLFCSGFSVGTATILYQAICRSCQSYTLHILASIEERRDGAVSRVVFVIFLCSLYCVTKTVLCCYALAI